MSFEDFLDMASVMSEHAPNQLKADWAFKMFGKDKRMKKYRASPPFRK